MKKLLLILLTFSILSLSAMEENHNNKRKAEESTEIEQVEKKPKQAEKIIRVMVDNGTETIVIPESLARMSRTFSDTIEDHPVILGDQDNREEIQLPQFKATEFNLLIQALQLVKEREEQQAFGIEKNQSILREDKHYVLETVYAILDPILNPLSYQQLLQFLALCNYLDIVDPAGSNFIVEAIMKELVKRYIADKNINLEGIEYPINFANEQVQEQFKQLFANLLKDFHPLAQEYIILQRIGAPGKRNIADYITLFNLEEVMTDSLELGMFKGKKLTSVNGINLLPKSIKFLELEYNYIAMLNDFSFSSQPQLQNLYLRKNWIYQIQEKAFSNLENLKYLYLDNNNLSIKTDLFQGCPQLQLLSLEINKKIILSEKSLKDLPIKELYLNHTDVIVEKNCLPSTIYRFDISFWDLSSNFAELNKQIPDAIVKMQPKYSWENKDNVLYKKYVRISTTKFGVQLFKLMIPAAKAIRKIKDVCTIL